MGTVTRVLNTKEISIENFPRYVVLGNIGEINKVDSWKIIIYWIY